MAADPSRVHAVSALSEVEGMGPDGVELSFAHEYPVRGTSEGQQYAGGMLTNMWKGLVDDVFGAADKAKPAL